MVELNHYEGFVRMRSIDSSKNTQKVMYMYHQYVSKLKIVVTELTSFLVKYLQETVNNRENRIVVSSVFKFSQNHRCDTT